MTNFEKEYAIICDCKDGIYRVSSVSFENSQMYIRLENTENEDIPGIWGYVDSNGREIIAPQYIYAYDFSGGLAYVAKGKWERRKEWDDKFWTAEQLWGRINKAGDEVIPCKFDRIENFIYTGIEDRESSYLKAHFGGWENGNWGIIDYSGNWIVEPIFHYMDYYIYNDDLIVFRNPYSIDPESQGPHDLVELYGIYSIKQKRILYKPEYTDIRFNKDSILFEKSEETITVKY